MRSSHKQGISPRHIGAKLLGPRLSFGHISLMDMPSKENTPSQRMAAILYRSLFVCWVINAGLLLSMAIAFLDETTVMKVITVSTVILLVALAIAYFPTLFCAGAVLALVLSAELWWPTVRVALSNDFAVKEASFNTETSKNMGTFSEADRMEAQHLFDAGFLPAVQRGFIRHRIGDQPPNIVAVGVWNAMRSMQRLSH